jgi:S-DNA-T family DNA segregation ATPase FtsK/SpoIIIE
VHLVLASQRPNGVVREQVSANCAIRVSLRVMQRADSLAVVGSDAAAAIGPETPGRGIVDPGDGRPVPFQSAWVEPATIEGLRPLDGGPPACPSPLGGPLPDRVTSPTSTPGRARRRSRRAHSSSGWPTSPSASVTSAPSGRPLPTGTCSSSAVPGAGARR